MIEQLSCFGGSETAPGEPNPWLAELWIAQWNRQAAPALKRFFIPRLRLLNDPWPETLAKATALRYKGVDRVFLLPFEWGTGFIPKGREAALRAEPARVRPYRATAARTASRNERPGGTMYRLYSWEHSYFSGKARAYLRYKQCRGGLGPGFEDVLASADLIQGLLIPRSGSNAVPQLEAPDGRWVQDTCEIIDFVEAAHPEPAISPPAAFAPRQRLAGYLIELLADEWMVVPAFWERWFFSEAGHDFSHRGFNEQQWGAVLAPGAPGAARRAAGGAFFEAAFGISDTRENPRGVYAGLVQLGVTNDTEPEWQASQHRILRLLEAHFGVHDYVLGGRPSLADFALLGPLYAHLYRDAVSGFALRTHFPLVCEWVERTNAEGCLNARSYNQRIYTLGRDGELIGHPATSDGGEWLPDDAIPETLLPMLAVFFDEMWPVLRSSLEVLRAFIASDAHESGSELPGKTFTATPGFEEHQTDDGALTHEFEIGAARARRMVVPYQAWMLQRVADELRTCTASSKGQASIAALLAPLRDGASLLELDDLLAGCRVRKQGGRLFSEP